MQAQTIEEVLQGPEGRTEKGLRPVLSELLTKARAQKVKDVEVEIRTTPAGSSSGRTETTGNFSVDAPPESVIESLRRMLESSPGDMFSGEIRLNFRARGDTSTYLGSFTRQMRPPQSVPVAASGDLQSVNQTITGLFKPLMDQIIRREEASTRLIEASGKMLEAGGKLLEGANGPRAGVDPKFGVLGELVRGTMSVAAANQANPTGAPAAPQPLASGAPPGPVDSPAPSSVPQLAAPAQIDEQQIRAWLANNQGAALRIASDMADDYGMRVVPKEA